MIETQATVTQWGVDTFGQPKNLHSLAARANTELAELIRWLAGDGNCPHAAEECADVAIPLMRLSEHCGIRFYPMPDDQIIAGAYYDDPVTPLVIASDAAVEIGVLISTLYTTRALAHKDVGRVSMRLLQGIVYRLSRICTMLGIDLCTEVEKKMAINRQRKWGRDDGTGHHERVRGAA
jgi:hypothetical protein